jgi:ParB-like chromosome segregation protein Spo0J
MVKFSRRKRASDLAGDRFWHPKIEVRAAQEVWTHEAERRTHSNKQRDKLLAIIRRFGFINPIIVEENDNVIAGHSILSV